MTNNIDWSELAPKKRPPTRKEKARYRRWRKYLSDSRLSVAEQHKRACDYAASGEEPKW